MARAKKIAVSGNVIIVIVADDESAEAIEAAYEAATPEGVEMAFAYTASMAADEDEEEEEEAEEEEEEDEEEDDEEEDDEEGEEESYSEADLKVMSLSELKALAEEYDIEGVKGKANLVTAILEAQGGDEEEEEEEDDEEEEEIDEETLQAMSLPKLKAFAKENGVTIPRGIKQDALVDLILDELAEEE